MRRGCRVLAIGAHPDDIELGAGGFIHALRTQQDARVKLLVLTAGIQAAWSPPMAQYDSSARIKECYKSARRLHIGTRDVHVKTNFVDCHLHERGHDLIREIEGHLYNKRRRPAFDVVLTHAGYDTHEDHRVVNEATLSAVRDFHGTVLMYPTPSTKPNAFRPTLFVRLAKKSVRAKHAALMEHVSQKNKPFMSDTRTRTAGSTWSLFLRLPPETYLEAFEVYKSFMFDPRTSSTR